MSLRPAIDSDCVKHVEESMLVEVASDIATNIVDKDTNFTHFRQLLLKQVLHLPSGDLGVELSKVKLDSLGQHLVLGLDLLNELIKSALVPSNYYHIETLLC